MSARQRRTRLGFHRDQADLTPGCLVGEEWKCGAAKVRPSAATGNNHIRVVASLLELFSCLEPDHGLVKQHVVENRPECVVGIATRRRLFNRLRYSDSKRAWRLRLEIQDSSSRPGFITWTCDHFSSPRLHHRSPKRLLLVADTYHVDPDLDAKHLTGQRERRTPLTRAGLGRETTYSGKMIGIEVRVYMVRVS